MDEDKTYAYCLYSEAGDFVGYYFKIDTLWEARRVIDGKARRCGSRTQAVIWLLREADIEDSEIHAHKPDYHYNQGSYDIYSKSNVPCNPIFFGTTHLAKVPATMADKFNTKELTPAAKAALWQLFLHGALEDDDITNKAGRNMLAELGYVERYDGWNWLSYEGTLIALDFGYGPAKDRGRKPRS